MLRWRILPEDCHFVESENCVYYNRKKCKCKNLRMTNRPECIIWEASPVRRFDILFELEMAEYGADKIGFTKERLLWEAEFGSLDR